VIAIIIQIIGLETIKRVDKLFLMLNIMEKSYENINIKILKWSNKYRMLSYQWKRWINSISTNDFCFLPIIFLMESYNMFHWFK